MDPSGLSQHDLIMTKVRRREAAQGSGPQQDRSSPAAQRFTDNLVRKALLWLFPKSAHPNSLTFARLAFVPLLLLLFYLDLRWWALGVFVVAVCTDFIDGALARTRNQITPAGTLLDPLADKLLVVTVLAWIGYKYLVVQIMLAFIVLELVVSLIGGSILLRTGDSRPANAFGKIKMVVQSVALFFFILSGTLELHTGVTISLYLLWAALALGILSGGSQVYGFLGRSRNHK
jgi:CDP-diacylglycerol--glycerol-3-phosphate 3-phosphatidyltransferase